MSIDIMVKQDLWISLLLKLSSDIWEKFAPKDRWNFDEMSLFALWTVSFICWIFIDHTAMIVPHWNEDFQQSSWAERKKKNFN